MHTFTKPRLLEKGGTPLVPPRSAELGSFIHPFSLSCPLSLPTALFMYSLVCFSKQDKLKGIKVQACTSGCFYCLCVKRLHTGL